LAGGIVSERNSFISKKVEERLSKELPGASLSRPAISPSEAAALLAFNLLASA